MVILFEEERKLSYQVKRIEKEKKYGLNLKNRLSINDVSMSKSSMSFQIVSSFGATLGSGSIAILDNHHILYICGSYICMANIASIGTNYRSSSSQRFISSSKEGKQIRCLCVSPSSTSTRGIAFAEEDCLLFVYSPHNYSIFSLFS